MSEARPLRWHAEELWEQLEPLLPGLSVEVLARTESTNSLLLERARSGGHRRNDAEPCLLVAELQTRGRGRLGRLWHAESGASLTFSLLLPMSASDWSGLSLVVGVALADALDPPSPGVPPRIALKWPNDLWLADGSDRKLGGILIETVNAMLGRMAVVGVGLNIAPQRGLPETASLQDIGIALDAPGALLRVAQPLVQALRRFETAGLAPFAERFDARDLLRGRPITTTLPDAPEGIAEGIDAHGALRVRGPAGELLISSGEVSVRPASRAGGGAH
jgi:BirA family biotin operon repressor/biotin-[acetyl-CoA-carboxylase] ligase